MKFRVMLALASASLCSVPADAQVVTNGGFENGTTGWTIGGTDRVASIQGNVITGTGANVSAPGGTNFAVLSTGPGTRPGNDNFRIDNNTVNDNDVATLSITVSIPHRPAVLAFDWTFPSSEQDQAGQYDDLFDVMVYPPGSPPNDGAYTTVGRVFSVSSPRNGTNNSNSNFPDAHKLGDAQITWTIGGGSAVSGTELRYRVPAWRHACVPIELPDTAPPFTRTIRFRVADQVDEGFDSAAFLDNVEVREACDATPLEHVTQVTTSSGTNLQAKGGGLNFRLAQVTRIATDPTGTVFAVASNADLDGNNPNFVEQVFIRVGGGGWQRVTGLSMQDGGSIQGLAFSGQPTSGSGQISGRYLAIAAKLSESDNTEIYRWDRNGSGSLTTVTSTTGCDNQNPAVNRRGNVIAFDSNCDALTGAGTNRHIVAWTGGVMNAVSNISGTGSCIARNPHLNHNSSNGGLDGRYVVYEASCNHGSNADGNFEIFRYNRNGGARRQITTTTSPVLNAGPQIDRDDNGQNVYFLSTANFIGGSNNSDGSMEVFRVQCNDANCTGFTGGSSGFFQWTSNPATSFVVAFKRMFDPDPGDDVTNGRFAFERLDLLTGASEVVYRDIAVASSERVLTLASGTPSITAGDDGGVPVVGLISVGDLIDQNPDENSEAFSVRVQ